MIEYRTTKTPCGCGGLGQVSEDGAPISDGTPPGTLAPYETPTQTPATVDWKTLAIAALLALIVLQAIAPATNGRKRR